MAPHPLFRHWVPTADLTGDIRTEVEMADDEPSGLDWLPDARLLVVAMKSQQLPRVELDGTLPLSADLSLVAGGSLNHMINAS
jgi:hypothetical protein